MNKLFLISLFFFVVAIGSLTFQVSAAPSCPPGKDLKGGYCYSRCANGEKKVWDWCEKADGTLYSLTVMKAE